MAKVFEIVIGEGAQLRDETAEEAAQRQQQALDNAPIAAEDAAVQARKEAAQTEAAGLPGWATFTAQEAEDYIDQQVTDLASAKSVLKKMARLLAALRDSQWPHLAGG